MRKKPLLLLVLALMLATPLRIKTAKQTESPAPAAPRAVG